MARMTRRQRQISAGAPYGRDSAGNFGRRHKNEYQREPFIDVATMSWRCSRCDWTGWRDEFEGHRCG